MSQFDSRDKAIGLYVGLLSEWAICDFQREVTVDRWSSKDDNRGEEVEERSRYVTLMSISHRRHGQDTFAL